MRWLRRNGKCLNCAKNIKTAFPSSYIATWSPRRGNSEFAAAAWPRGSGADQWIWTRGQRIWTRGKRIWTRGNGWLRREHEIFQFRKFSVLSRQNKSNHPRLLRACRGGNLGSCHGDELEPPYLEMRSHLCGRPKIYKKIFFFEKHVFWTFRRKLQFWFFEKYFVGKIFSKKYIFQKCSQNFPK